FHVTGVQTCALPIFFLLMLLWTACRRADTDTSPSARTFTPSGNLSDLVHNPVRPDGTIDSSYLPVITWDTVLYDFGEVQEGDIVRHTYSFTNTGTAPLLITQASSTCGCTVPEWPKEPIAPGSSGAITVSFNTAGRPGTQSKPVTIFANTYPNEQKIHIRGYV